MWQIILAIGFIFLLCEILLPSLFCLNFAVSAFLVAILSLYVHSIPVLVIVFCVLSVLLIYTLRPMLLKTIDNKNIKTGMDDKYVGKNALAVEDIDKNSGAVTIYDERWQARNIDDCTIEKGSMVEIVGYESIVMKVRKIN